MIPIVAALGAYRPSWDTHLRMVRRLPPETPMPETLLLLDGSAMVSLGHLVLA